jgi:hypothetical protein
VGHLFARVDGRAADEFEVARHVVEQDFAVLWMDIVLHDFALVVW